MKKRNSGFTLIELLIVITMLALMGTIAYKSLTGYTEDLKEQEEILEDNINKECVLEHAVEIATLRKSCDDLVLWDNAECKNLAMKKFGCLINDNLDITEFDEIEIYNYYE